MVPLCMHALYTQCKRDADEHSTRTKKRRKLSNDPKQASANYAHFESGTGSKQKMA